MFRPCVWHMRLLWTALAAPLLGAAGCGSSTATVSGTVKFNDQPLRSGTVLFHGADGRIEHGLINRDGTYSVVNAPLGPVRITVQSHAAKPPGLPMTGEPPPAAPGEFPSRVPDIDDSKLVAIPLRYAQPQQSGLALTVKAGLQRWDIELKN